MLKVIFFNQAPYTSRFDNGDCTYVELPNGQNILIDISTQNGGLVITKRLLDMGVRNINYLVVSHLHSDHTAGFHELVKEIEVEHILTSGYGFSSMDADVSFLEMAAKRNISMQSVRMGDKFVIDNAIFEFIFPPREIEEVLPELPYIEQEGNSNRYSLVLRITYGEFSILFAGDIMADTEKQLVESYGERLSSKVLKIPHHGSNTSASKEFINVVKPCVAVTMCRGNDWEVQQRFSNAKIPVYGPFNDGTIIMKTDGVLLNISCNKGLKIMELSHEETREDSEYE